MKKLLLAGMILFISGCALILPPRETRVRGYGAWMDELPTPWRRAPSDIEGGFAFVKSGETSDETIAVQMWPEPAEAAPDADYLVTRLRNVADAAERSERYQNVQVSTEPFVDAIEKVQCAAYHFVYEDLEAVKHSQRDVLMLLDIVGTLCVHPQDDRLLINRHASRRYYPEFARPDWPTEARRLTNSIYLDFIKPIDTDERKTK